MQSHLPLLQSITLKSLTAHKRRLVEVPYTASLSDTINALIADNLVAVPVAAPPGRWIGAGGSMILESDGVTGSIRKQYIGIVTMLDILHHLADHCELLGDMHILEARLAVPVSSLIGNDMEGLSLWTFSPTTSLIDCMEVFSKGIHRALVPLDSQMEHVIGVELAEASPGYRMVTQMDVLTFVVNHNADELQDVLGRTVEELGAVNKNALAVTNQDTLLHTIKVMRTASLNAVPIVDALQAHSTTTHDQLIDGKGRKLVGTFSSTDLRGCPIAQLGSWLHINIVEFTEKMTSTGPRTGEVNVAGDWAPTFRNKLLVTCDPHTSLGEAIGRAVAAHVHQVWVVDSAGLLGVVALTDMLRVIRAFVLG